MTTLERLGNFVIGFLMAIMPYLPNFRSLGPSHGLEEAPVVHRLGHGHVGEVGQPQHWLPCGQYEVHIKFQIFGNLLGPAFELLRKIKKEEEEENLWLLDLRLESRR